MDSMELKGDEVGCMGGCTAIVDTGGTYNRGVDQMGKASS